MSFFENVPYEKKKITVQHLLTHTSGIVRREYPEALKGQTHDAFAKEILAQPLMYPVGQDYRYSCSGMVLMGFILENDMAIPWRICMKSI